MWLTRLKKASAEVTDGQQHQLLYGFFKDNKPSTRPFCFKDMGDELLMLSNMPPNTTSQEMHFTDGQVLMFECRASINNRNHQGKTIKSHQFTSKHVKEWFKRRLSDGACVDFVSFKSLAPHKVYKNDGTEMIFDQKIFYGTLTVTNAKRFEEILAVGIGRGCAFGFGLVYLPQVM